MVTIPFTREKTQILKGVGLLLMLVHHICWIMGDSETAFAGDASN
jgi:hypothetical protein